MEAARESCQWYEVEIAFSEGKQWTKLCSCEASACIEPSAKNSSSSSRQEIPRRQVASAYWYDVMESKGLKYGPAYRGLDAMTAALGEEKAFATVSPMQNTDYVLHPVNIDQCLQLVAVAACKGQGRLLKGPSITTAIKYLVVSGCGQAKIRLQGDTTENNSDCLIGEVSTMTEDCLRMLSIQQCKVSSVPSAWPKRDNSLFSFVKWDVDTAYCDLNQLLISSESFPGPSSIFRVIEILCHKNPSLSILGLGDGAAKTLRLIVDGLQSRGSGYDSCTCTYATASVNTAFKAKAMLKGSRNTHVVVFDTEQWLQSQSLKKGAYDIILITDVWIAHNFCSRPC